jgi:hypothetical protein
MKMTQHRNDTHDTDGCYGTDAECPCPLHKDADGGHSASLRPLSYTKGDVQKWLEDYYYEHHINFAKRIETGGEESKRLDELMPEILKAFLDTWPCKFNQKKN